MTSRFAGTLERLAPYAIVTIAVWGLFVFDRGLWNDDVQVLFRMFVAPGREGLFPALASPTRRLQGLPFLAALATGHPRLALELQLGLAWLLTGLMAERLAALLWPGRRRLAVMAALLTLSATPDGFTASLVGLGYVVATLLALAGCWGGLAYVRGSGRLALVGACLAIVASLFVIDVGLPLWLLAPGLWWLVREGEDGRRRFRHARLAWGLVALPYLVVFAGAWLDPGSYARHAFTPLTPGEWLGEWAELVAFNFEPWRWAWGRSRWLAPEPALVPAWFSVSIALVCALLAARLAARTPIGEVPAPRARTMWLACLAVAACSNAGFVGLPNASAFCRTHFLSRVFAALAVAALLDACGPTLRRWATGGLALLVALGVLGGLACQDYLAGHWRRHRAELLSLVEAAPRLAPQARVLLRVREPRGYMATSAGYLARAWLVLLHEDPSLECRVFLWSTPRGSSCTAEREGLRCRGERSPDCPRLDGRDEELLPYEELLFFEADARGRRFDLLERLPPDSLPPGPEAAYAPALRIAGSRPTPLALSLLGGGPGLIDWLAAATPER